MLLGLNELIPVIVMHYMTGTHRSNLQVPNHQMSYGLAPTRLQAIIWTNDGKFIDAYIRHPASMS